MACIEYIENLRNRIKDSVIRLTPQRAAILDVLIENRNKHLTVEEIYVLSKSMLPQVGIPTVYRTVQQFEKIGVLYKITIYGQCWKYQLIIPGEKDRHRHFICTQCKNITDIDPTEFSAAEQQIESKYGVSIANQNIIYYGLCSSCRHSNHSIADCSAVSAF